MGGRGREGCREGLRPAAPGARRSGERYWKWPLDYPQGGHLGKRGPREVVDELESDQQVGLLLSEVGFPREEKQEKPGEESL